MAKTVQAQPGALLRPADAAALLGVSRQTLYKWRLIKAGFPQLISLSARASGFRREELMQWIDEQAAKSAKGAA